MYHQFILIQQKQNSKCFHAPPFHDNFNNLTIELEVKMHNFREFCLVRGWRNVQYHKMFNKTKDAFARLVKQNSAQSSPSKSYFRVGDKMDNYFLHLQDFVTWTSKDNVLNRPWLYEVSKLTLQTTEVVSTIIFFWYAHFLLLMWFSLQGLIFINIGL